MSEINEGVIVIIRWWSQWNDNDNDDARCRQVSYCNVIMRRHPQPCNTYVPLEDLAAAIKADDDDRGDQARPELRALFMWRRGDLSARIIASKEPGAAWTDLRTLLSPLMP